ncbi:MAG TPA: hypothetical protein VKL40_15075 [Candidatus Angelobacter sp.]|nr:hypothetical protein [Candidatus Angelobacter sp.]
MPVSYEIDKEKRLVVCNVTGFCTADDVLGFHKRIVNDREFDPGFSQLVDCTGITGSDIAPGQMKFVAAQSPFSLDSRRALIADSDLGFALLRVYEIVRGLRGDRQVRVFRSRAAALEWLLEKKQAA